jgi:hypothetical protein
VLSAVFPSPLDDACACLSLLLHETSINIPQYSHLFGINEIDLILKLVYRVLKTNMINHRGMLYLQLVEGAMGSSCFPSIAIIFLHVIEHSLVSSFLSSECCRLFLRYSDEIFCVFSSEEEAKTFYTMYNALHSNINLTWSDTHEGGVVFLDLCFYKGPRFENANMLDSKIYQKPNNAFLYLHCTSFHSDSARKSWGVNRLVTAIIYCSSEASYSTFRDLFAECLLGRGFPLRTVTSIIIR